MNNYCIEPNCDKCVSFNYKGIPALYCGKHAKSNMIDVSHRKCLYTDCPTISCFNYANETSVYIALNINLMI